MLGSTSYQRQDRTFEHTVYRTSLLIGIIIAIVLTTLDMIYLGLDLSILLEGIGLAFLLIFYILSSKYKASWQYIFFILLFFSLNNVAWLYDGGSNIIHIIIYLLISIYAILIVPPIYRLALMVFIVANGALLVIIEVFGDIDVYYLDYQTDQQFTFRIILFCGLLSLLFAMIFFRSRFDRERTSLLAKNQELVRIHELVKQRNSELIESTEQLTKINKEIESESKKLELKNEEIQNVKSTLEKNVLERTKQLLRKNQELDLLFYRSSHDFRRPLTSLLGLSEFAQLIAGKDEKEILGMVADTAEEMDKMFRKFNSLYQINHFEEEFKQFSLNEVLDKIKAIASRADCEIELTTEGIDLDNIDSKNLLVLIILENLIENSINYRNPNINCLVNLDISRSDQNLIITYKDNGFGISDQYIAKVFDMYFKANLKSKGNGLGLYVVNNAVNKLEGHIDIKSKEWLFTRFEISLPYFSDDKPTTPTTNRI